MKRVFDLSVTLLAAPLWLPLVALVGVLSLLIQGRPVLFFQERIGKDCRPFRLVKFRTMREGAGDDATRMTRFGSFLRRSSLDELPELFCVLRGEMSLVGPRPLPVRYLPRYTPTENRRHEVLPGITGWAQVNGRNALDWDEKLRLDVEYVDRHSLFFDLRILFLTVRAVFASSGISHEGSATMTEFRG